MSSFAYFITISDPFGTPLADASFFVSLKYTRVVNDIGSLTIELPNSFNTSLLRAPDGRIEVWRQIPGGLPYLDTGTTWLIKKVTSARDDRGLLTTVVEADTPLSILREPGRFVNYNADDAASSFTATAYDDAMKTIVRQNAGTGTSGQRNIAAYLSIAGNLSLAPAGSKAFAWRDVLKVLQEIATASAQNSVYLAFDIVAPTPDTLEFRTYTQQRGTDHRFPAGLNPIIIGPDFGNMGACNLTTDWRDEITYALAAGRGEGSERLGASAIDSTRMGMSPFGWREKFVNATQYDSTTGLSAEAEAMVRNGRPRRIFRGKILDVPDTRYGVHWAWGDFVTVQAFGESFDARIDAIEVEVRQGRETINAWVRGDL